MSDRFRWIELLSNYVIFYYFLKFLKRPDPSYDSSSFRCVCFLPLAFFRQVASAITFATLRQNEWIRAPQPVSCTVRDPLAMIGDV